MRALTFTLLLLTLACSESRPDRYSAQSGGSGQGGDAGRPPTSGGSDDDDCPEPIEIDTSRLCGSQVVPVVTKRPNLYFVVDVSGSMAESISPSSNTTKLAATKQALVSVASELGHRVSYGLAAYPGEDEDDSDPRLAGCGAGSELFETMPGDPLSCGKPDGGPVLDEFTDVVLGLDASGGTPLSPTLDELQSKLLTLDGVTSVLLMTDGGPNCNPDASCDVDECIPNIEGGEVASGPCDDEYNCCDSSVVRDEDLPYIGIPEAGCVDSDESIAQIEALRSVGILTYVVGVPGSEVYADTMNALAEAGGTARAGDGALYYDVSDVDELNEALLLIGSEVAASCDLVLDEPPAEPGLLNVYFDGVLLEADPENGWSIEGDVVTLHGEACVRLRAGEVGEVALLSGCKTIIR